MDGTSRLERHSGRICVIYAAHVRAGQGRRQAASAGKRCRDSPCVIERNVGGPADVACDPLLVQKIVENWQNTRFSLFSTVLWPKRG